EGAVQFYFIDGIELNFHPPGLGPTGRGDEQQRHNGTACTQTRKPLHWQYPWRSFRTNFFVDLKALPQGGQVGRSPTGGLDGWAGSGIIVHPRQTAGWRTATGMRKLPIKKWGAHAANPEAFRPTLRGSGIIS